jgi:hypothetical protein
MKQKNKTFFVELRVGVYVDAENGQQARSIAHTAFWKMDGCNLDIEDVSINDCEECGGEE